MQRYVHDANTRGGHGKRLAYASFEEFVLTHGQVFEPPLRPRPKGVRNGTDKMCFRNAGHVALDHDRDGWQYVEGYGIGIIPAHHAWVLDADGNVVETTWKESGSAYFGVVFPDDLWKLTINLTGVWGVLGEFLLAEPYTEAGYRERLRAALKVKRRG
jgi:hypothetical protein